MRADTLPKEKVVKTAAAATDPAAGIRQIDVHTLTVEAVYTRFSTSPSIGLESEAVERRVKDGKNVISKPPTQYWKKALNYVFGGFNFLMWIAFIVTIVRPFLTIPNLIASHFSPPHSSPTSLSVSPTQPCSIWASPSSSYVTFASHPIDVAFTAVVVVGDHHLRNVLRARGLARIPHHEFHQEPCRR